MTPKRYTLDEKAAQKLRRLLNTMEMPVELRNPERKSSPWTVAKIESHEGGGVYQAIEVFWDGAAWADDADISRKFGATYSTKGVRHLAGNEDIPDDSYVIVFPLQTDTTDEMAEWVFGEPVGEDFWHPFKGRIKPETNNQIEIGYLRDPVYTPNDQVTILDQADVELTTQIQTVNDPSPVDSAVLSGDGYIYYILERTLGGSWAFNTDAPPGQVKNSAVWPPVPDNRDTIPILIGNYTDAGTSNFKWWQVLRDDPYVWPRPMQPDFFPIYYHSDTPTAHAAVHISAGKIHFRSDATAQSFDVAAQDMDVTVVKYYYLEVVTTPGNTSHVDSVTAKIETTFPGYCVLPNKINYLIGETDGTRYKPHVIGTIFDGTVFQPNFTINQHLDAQGLRVISGNLTHVEGEGLVNSYFLELWKPGLHWKFGDLDKMDDGTKTTIGGTDDDIEQIFVSGLENDCTNHRLVIHKKKITINVTAGLVTKCQIDDEADEYIDYTEVTAVTNLQVSGLNFQKKTRKFYAMCADAEGSWTTWHTGTNCPTPP